MKNFNFIIIALLIVSFNMGATSNTNVINSKIDLRDLNIDINSDFKISKRTQSFLNDLHKEKFWRNLRIDSIAYSEIQWKYYIPIYDVDKDLNIIRDSSSFELYGITNKGKYIYLHVLPNPIIKKFPYTVSYSAIGENKGYWENIEYTLKCANKCEVFALRLPEAIHYAYGNNDSYVIVRHRFKERTAQGNTFSHELFNRETTKNYIKEKYGIR